MFSIKKRINFYDCDPAGILFYAKIFEICHSVYEEMIDNFNLKEDYWQNEHYAVPIIKSEANYLKPITSGEYLYVELSVSELRDSSFELSYECKNEQGDLIAVAKTVHVIADKKSWDKRNLTEEIRIGLSHHLKN